MAAGRGQAQTGFAHDREIAWGMLRKEIRGGKFSGGVVDEDSFPTVGGQGLRTQSGEGALQPLRIRVVGGNDDRKFHRDQAGRVAR